LLHKQLAPKCGSLQRASLGRGLLFGLSLQRSSKILRLIEFFCLIRILSKNSTLIIIIIIASRDDDGG